MVGFETAQLPAPRYLCRCCIHSGSLAVAAEKMTWYDGKGDIFTGWLPEGDEEPRDEERYPAGFYCYLCIEYMHDCLPPGHFGPTLAVEMRRRSCAADS